LIVSGCTISVGLGYAGLSPGTVHKSTQEIS